MATNYHLTMSEVGCQLVVVMCEHRPYVVRWSPWMSQEIDMCGDGRGFDDIEIPPPPKRIASEPWIGWAKRRKGDS